MSRFGPVFLILAAGVIHVQKYFLVASQQGGVIPACIQWRRYSISRYAGGIARLLNFSFLLLAFSFRASGQSYTVDWYKIPGGGGTSTGGTYQVSGTIGQPDAGGAMTGGNFSVTGGFWSIVSVVQTAGVPNLVIIPGGANSVTILWPDPATNTFILQQNANLALATWTASGYAITNANGTNSIIITPPAGNLFFRLMH